MEQPRTSESDAIRVDVVAAPEFAGRLGLALAPGPSAGGRQLAEVWDRDLAQELADVMEVVPSLARLEGIDLHEIERIRRLRADERGAFRQRLFLEGPEGADEAP